MFQRVAWIAAAWVMAGAAQAAEPKWLTDARARESKLIAPTHVASVDNWVTAKVPAKSKGKVEKSEGTYSFEFDIGSASPVFCEVIPDGFDHAEMIRGSFDLLISRTEELQGKVEMRELEKIDSGAFAATPWLGARWLYLVNDGKQKVIGAYQHTVFPHGNHGVLCSHNDIGYVKTYDQIVKAFAESLKIADPVPAPYYHEIAVVKIGGKPAGVASISLTRDGDGDTEAVQSSSVLIPVGAGKVTSQDTYHREWVRPDDTIINSIHTIASNGEVSLNLALKRVDEVWTIDGEMQGKKFSQALKAGDEPGSYIRQSHELSKLLSSGKATGADHSIAMWVSADPTRLHDAKTKIGAKTGDQHAAVVTVAALKADIVLDANGMPSIAKMPMGPQVVSIERVYVTGKP